MARRIYIAYRGSPDREDHSETLRKLVVRYVLLKWLWRAVKYGCMHAPTLQRERRISYFRQAWALLKLIFVHRIDPITYYSQQLYDHPLGVGEAANFLGRHETKNGLYTLLRRLRKGDPHGSASLSNKIKFAEHCRLFGVPTPPVLARERSKGDWELDADPEALHRDLFAKPEDGRGAVGAGAYRYAGAGKFVADGDDRALTQPEMLDRVTRASERHRMILAPRLVNHAEIADLAEQSLLAFRVFTCMDAANQPVVTHAMIRIISKLEPTWGTKEEFAIPIDLESGRLGMMCGDKNLAPGAFWKTHPYTCALISGREVSAWPQLSALAIEAHRAFSGRLIVGWDMAWTPEGIIVLEGNSDPDTHFLQRVHRVAIGHSPMASLLRYHFPRVEALLAGRQPDGSKR